MPEVNFVDIDKRLAALQSQIVRIKRAPLLSKAPLVEKAVEDFIELLLLMVAEMKARAELIVYCKCGFEVRTNHDFPFWKCPNCERPLRAR